MFSPTGFKDTGERNSISKESRFRVRCRELHILLCDKYLADMGAEGGGGDAGGGEEKTLSN